MHIIVLLLHNNKKKKVRLMSNNLTICLISKFKLFFYKINILHHRYKQFLLLFLMWFLSWYYFFLFPHYFVAVFGHVILSLNNRKISTMQNMEKTLKLDVFEMLIKMASICIISTLFNYFSRRINRSSWWSQYCKEIQWFRL